MTNAMTNGNAYHRRKSTLATFLLAAALATSLLLFARDTDETVSQLHSVPSSVALRDNDINIINERQLLLDPKSVEPRIPANSASDNGDRKLALDLLKQTEDLWIREFCPPRYCSSREEKDAELESARAIFAHLDEVRPTLAPLDVCGRLFSWREAAVCPEFDREKPLILIRGFAKWGRTGNNLAEVLHAVQYARENGVQLGIMSDTWATRVVSQFFAANTEVNEDWAGGTWQATMEQILCAKIFNSEEELEGLDVSLKNSGQLFEYQRSSPLGEYMAIQMEVLQRMYAHYNTGEGIARDGTPVRDMCSGVDAIFPDDEERRTAVYSVIHSRHQEGHPGIHHMAVMSRRSGCDPSGALYMEPDYIKSILEPLGMLKHPIVFIWDGENPAVLDRLRADPDIGPELVTVPGGSSWIGGDITLGVASNVFIGNPASSFANFIVKTRLALGMGHNEMYRAKDENGEW
eukprot:CAMPEP_0172533386 /NCGR_PEP_ID=MMETSP1067-20121228/6117_1 /TAXON_ID=265564 ORGANISM="Thalassiosira punctigera, Strain Tpunct2005C2" /NCGR_SAMPLE_ID=MMETSP1067 /ASSEMBLY_ACC=CAM_ASM_000444 /LENGTH=462 /DNA_ID=CAMNT_0013318031 /DNA_START=39 /DNA_END=1424 /DNA_ORIENTATION=-